MSELLVRDDQPGPVTLHTEDAGDWLYQDETTTAETPEPGEDGVVSPVTVLSRTVIDTTQSGQDWDGRSSIVTRPDGTHLMCFRSGSKHQINDGALHLMEHDGSGWSPLLVSGFPMNPTTSPGEDAGEPWLFYAPNGDLLLHMWRVDYGVSVGGTWQSRSTDDGQTWSTPEQVTYVGLQGVQQDRTFTTCDTVTVNGSIYAAGRVFWDTAGSNASAILARSDDNGVTWVRQSTILSGDGSEVGLEYVGGSTFVAMIRDIQHTKSYRFVSTDMGDTWSGDDVTDEVGIAARQRVFTVDHLQHKTDWWNDSRLVMVGFVHQQSGSSHPRRNAVWLSTDSGGFWSSPFYLGETVEDAGYGDIYHVSGNEYAVVTYEGTLDAANVVEYRLLIEV